MAVEYLQVSGNNQLLNISYLQPFKCVVIIEELISTEEQKNISRWLVNSGCLYMMAWGVESSSWDDSVDYANLELFDYEDIPDEYLVMTTWHEHESLKDVFWFCKNSVQHEIYILENVLILHITNQNRCEETLRLYEDA
jgi:hypothetical protein